MFKSPGSKQTRQALKVDSCGPQVDRDAWRTLVVPDWGTKAQDRRRMEKLFDEKASARNRL